MPRAIRRIPVVPPSSTADAVSRSPSPRSRPSRPRAPCANATAASPSRASEAIQWQRFPPEIREKIASRMSARDLAALGRTHRDGRRLSRSACVIAGQSAHEATRSVWRLAREGCVGTLTDFMSRNDARHVHWHHRNAQGATMLMEVLKRGPLDMAYALLNGSPALFAGLDSRGDNLLHYAVERGDASFLSALLRHHPLLNGYTDIPGWLGCTPLEQAYDKKDDLLFAVLSQTPVTQIDQWIDVAMISGLRSRPVTPMPGVGAGIEELFHGDMEGLAQQLVQCAAAQDDTPVDRVFPFDRNAVPWRFGAPMACTLGFRPLRRAVDTRLRLAFRAIEDGESGILERTINALPAAAMMSSRPRVLEAVSLRGHFESVRVIARYYRDQIFVPLRNGQTILHLISEEPTAKVISWLLLRPGAMAVLRARNSHGQTPLLQAASQGNLRSVEVLAGLYGPGPLGDIDHAGNGLLRSCFWHDPCAALKLLSSPGLAGRITPEDGTDTLQLAFNNLLGNASDSTCITDAHCLNDHLAVMRTLLSQGRGQIDIQARVGPRSRRIIDVLRQDELSPRLDIVRNDVELNAIDLLQETYEAYDNSRLLNAAHAHE